MVQSPENQARFSTSQLHQTLTIQPQLSPRTSLLTKQKTLWARIFLPKQALDAPLSDKKALPVVVYLHGGGFITSIGAASIVHHGFCSNLASHVQAIVISVEHRLAPEHRLTAAYDDAIEATHFIKNSDEVWFKEHADHSSCYVTGKSAGGNIAYNAGLR
ncbi:hypothetical protein NC652_010844 [Populus alba x Populus x berolinensis]|nr:hypothetical protein NC652_010844 [Populus alba x Populus x berolinensis]